MNSKPRVLLIPEAVNIHIEDTDWIELQEMAEITIFPLKQDSELLSGNLWGIELSRCLELALDCRGKYDLVIGECTGAFLWNAVFRLSGDITPFAILPHFNHVSLTHAYAALLSSQLVLSADIVFAGSKVACNSFAKFGFRSSPLYPPGINLGRFRPLDIRKKSLRTGLGLPNENDVLLYTGRVTHDKNVLELLDVYKLVASQHPCELVICYHYFSDEYLEMCKQKTHGNSHVHFVRHSTVDTLVKYYNAADVFLSTAVSEFETFGRAPLEAMACGTPPIISEYNGFRENVSLETGILVPTWRTGAKPQPNVQAFAEAVLTLLTDKVSLAKRASLGRDYVQRFNSQITMRRMLEQFTFMSPNGNSASQANKNMYLSLECYPQVLKNLWKDLEGAPIAELMDSFLRTGTVPLRPEVSHYQRFRDSWFIDY